MEKIGNLKMSKHYRLQCGCLTPADAMDIEVMQWGKDNNRKHVDITMYFQGTGLWSRIKYAFWILKGHWEWRGFVVREEDYRELSEIFNPDKGFSELP